VPVAALIDSSVYPEIRALIDSSIAESQLPDSMISMSVFQGMAEKEVVRMYPNAYIETDAAKLSHIQRATIYLTAAFLAPSVPDVISEHFGNYQYRRNSLNTSDLADRLRGMAEDEINQILDLIDSAEIIPIMFTTAWGPRGS
jgi:hypothetical protein